jgi:hypothetical protein
MVETYLGVPALFIAYDLSLLEVQYSGQDFRSLSLGCKNIQFGSITLVFLVESQSLIVSDN